MYKYNKFQNQPRLLLMTRGIISISKSSAATLIWTVNPGKSLSFSCACAIRFCNDGVDPWGCHMGDRKGRLAMSHRYYVAQIEETR